MCELTRFEYRSLTCAGSNPVSADSNRTRSTFASSGVSRLSSAARTRAEAIRPALPTAKRRRSMPLVIGSGLLRRAGGRVVEVDEVPPVLPEHGAAIADHALLGHVEREAIEDVFVGHVGQADALGLAER